MGRSRALTKIAKDIDDDGNLLASAISPDVTLGGATVYDTRDDLPVSGNNEGDQAYVTANNRLYIWNGSGWYSVALLNVAPTIQSIQDSDGNTTPFELSAEGVVTTITITAADSDGDPITYSAVADSDFSGLATLSQDENVFTVTPFSQDSASTTSGTITFNATDGVNIASSGVQTFTLSFVSALWKDVGLSIGTSSTDGLDNSTFVDRSTNAHTVTPTGSPVQTAFHPYLDHWSVEFDGSNGDYLRCDEALDGFSSVTDVFTIEAWLYPTVEGDASAAPDDYFFGLNRVNDGNNQLTVGMQNIYYAGDPYDLNTVIPTYAWTHIAVVFDGTDLKIYTNGVLNTTVTDSVETPLQDLTFGIGTEFDSSSLTPGNYYTGHISNVRVSDIVRYTADFIPPTEKFVDDANTTFIGLQSNRFIDTSSNGNTVVVVDDPKISTFNPFGQESEYAAGENKGSVELNGSDQNVNIPDDDDFELTGDFTLELWTYYRSGGGTYTAVIGGNASTDNGWNIYITTSSNVLSFFHDGFRITSSAGAVINDQWHHVALTRSGSNTKLFLDGEQVGSTYTGTETYNQNTGNNGTVIGYDHGANGRFNGYISDLKLINGTALYTSAFTPPTAPVGNTNADLYLPMDNAGIFDKTGNHTLTLVGDTATSTTQTKFADTAMYFDGSGDYIVVPESEHTKFSSGEDFTIELWHYLNERSGTRDCLISNYTSFGAGSLAVFAGHGSSTTSQYQLAFDGQFPAINAGTINYNQWVHLALVRSANVISLYIDGASVGSVTNGDPVFSTGGEWVIANAADNLANGDINGYIENLQILKGVAKYTSNFTVPAGEQGRTYQAED